MYVRSIIKEETSKIDLLKTKISETDTEVSSELKDILEEYKKQGTLIVEEDPFYEKAIDLAFSAYAKCKTD